jgi:hypothetical protein
MTRARFCAWTLLAATGFTLLPAAPAQDKVDPTKVPQFSGTGTIIDRRNASGIPKGDLPAVQKTFAAFAQYYADSISHPLVIKATQDPLLKLDADKRPIPKMDDLFDSVNRFLLEPSPTSRVTADNLDYIRELGYAFDAALKPLITNHPETIVRVNAMRFYAVLCRTGAPAHWATVTDLLANENTRTEVKYYALQAAGNLLSAYDADEYKSRRHALDENPRPAADKKIGALVAAVQDCVVNPNKILAGIPQGKVENATPEQVEVIRFVRRQAIRALGEVRFATLPGPDGNPLYPAHTLIRVCMSDPTLGPAPSPSECGEAVIGLCNMSHITNGKPERGFNPDAVVEAVAQGIITFATPRTDRADRSLPWKGYALRINDAFRKWPPLFDPLFDPQVPNVFNAQQTPGLVTDVIKRTRDAILTPIDTGAAVDLDSMRKYLTFLRERKQRTGILFSDVPGTAVPAPKQ